MVQTIVNDKGEDIEVYTAEEMNAQVDEKLKAKDEEFGVKLTAKEQELADARKALGDRAGEFKQFRKISDEAVQKLGVAERTIYENQLLMQQMKEEGEAKNKQSLDNTIDMAIRAKTGGDEKLYTKIKETYSVINLEANTSEQITNKINMAIGAIGITEPNILAELGSFQGGSFQPKIDDTNKEKTYADTDAGKGLAAQIGLKL